MMFNWITLTISTLVILPLMIWRARAEERELTKVLPGYPSYQESVRMLTPTITGIYAVEASGCSAGRQRGRQRMPRAGSGAGQQRGNVLLVPSAPFL